MRALKWFRDLLEWRWAPFVALVGAALLYVLLMVLLIPSEIGSGPGATAASLGSRFGTSSELQGVGPDTLSTAAPAVDSHAPEPPPTHIAPQAPPITPQRRGFSPPLPRAEPAEPPPSIPPPLPPPANVVLPPAPEATEPPPAPAQESAVPVAEPDTAPGQTPEGAPAAE
jgi:hypothetical protein